MQGRSGEVDINKIDTYSTWECLPEHFAPFLPNPTAEENHARVATLRPRVQEALVAQGGSLFVKTHLAALQVRGTPTINGGVTRGAAYIVRNPLDVACSLAPHMGWTLDEAIEIMGTVGYYLPNRTAVLELISSRSQNVESWTRQPHKAVRVIRYEDMVAEPIKTISGFVRQTGLKASREHVQKAIALAAFDRLRGREASDGFKEAPPTSTDQFFRRGRTGQWRETLTKSQVDRIVSAHENQMSKFGYLKDL
jgi:hypothetical protein